MKQNDRITQGLQMTASELQALVNYLGSCEQPHAQDWEYCQHKIAALQRQLKSYQQLLHQQKRPGVLVLPWLWN